MTLDSTAAAARPPGPRRRGTRRLGTRRRVAGVLALIVFLLAAAGPARAVSAVDAGTAAGKQAGRAQGAVTGDGPLVVLGIGGLTWADISPATTPHIWRLAERSAKGDLSLRTTRSTSCALDGWLTLGAGRRAGTKLPTKRSVRCPAMPRIEPAGHDSGHRAGREPVPAEVTGWGAYRTFNSHQAYQAKPGTLATTVAADDGMCTLAIGPGAATALADRSGTVQRYLEAGTVPSPGGPHRLGTCPLSLVDLGSVGDSSWLPNSDTTSWVAGDHRAKNTVPDALTLGNDSERDRLAAAVRATQLRDADRMVGRYVHALPHDASVMLLGLSDSSYSPQLGAIMIAGGGRHGLLTSDSTRRRGLVQLTDVTPTITRLLGEKRHPAFVGTPATHADQAATKANGPDSTLDEVNSLREDALKASLVHDSVGAFSIWLDIAFYVFFILVALGLYRGRRDTSTAARRTGRSRAACWTALALGAVPAGTFVANLAPWARGPHPVALLAAGILVGAAAVFAVTLIRPWGRTWLGRVGALGLVTAGILGVDVATGSHLQLNSLLGYNAIVGGRFYGIGNLAVALYIVGALMGTAALVSPLRRRGAAVAVATVLGLATVTVIGEPAWGAKVGGTIAAVAGFGVLVLLLAGVRLGIRRLVAVAVIALAALFAVAGLDYLRPPGQRSHFGIFFQHVLSGDMGEVIARKLEANLSILVINPLLSLLVPVGFVMIALVLGWAARWRRRWPRGARAAERFAGRLPEAADRRPALGLGLAATSMALAVGLVITDSGAAVPATGFMLLIPMLVAACGDIPAETSRS
ncbi:hypothetical protein [Spelaeicoccus albus]|uniref:hypothetical protein n=1 Tax=Spelaeicoccus albus TaxID=1280376 RepID=UPI001F37991F|nr:hypothetical protein [Spelaeicoccus albus]